MRPTLPREIVGIDVETTSLDPTEGDIIEIAAVIYTLDSSAGKLSGSNAAEFIKLAQPSSPLSTEITAITNITQEMVADQPPFSAFTKDLQEFIGDRPLFAHNASFDIGYLAQHGVKLPSNVWDTFALASIAWPQAPSYNLGMLAEQLHITVAGEHRAGDDVHMTWQLLQRIAEQLQVTPETYATIAELLTKSGQDHYLPLFTRMKVPPAAPRQPGSSKRVPVTGNLSRIFAASGPLAQSIDNFSHRPQQLEMAQFVATMIKERDIGLVEAGTGTGKTYGYLVPLIASLQDNRSAVISTHTKNLQDQLMQQDLPRLLKALKLNLKTAVLKGRRNYLCYSRLLQAIGRDNIKSDEALLLIKLLVWLEQGGSGDLEHLNASHQALHLLNHVHADALSCRVTCSKKYPQCPYQRARRTASEADVVIINHALLVQLGGEESPLPISNLLIDEAHHVDDVARAASGRNFSEHRVAELVAPFVRVAKSLPPTQQRLITTEANDLLRDYQKLINNLTAFVKQHAPDGTLRLSAAARRSTSWSKMAEKARTWRSRLQFVIGLLESIPADSPERETTIEAKQEAEKFSREFEQFIEGDAQRIQWLELPYVPPGRQGVKEQLVLLEDVALSSMALLKPLFDSAASVTLASATLTTNGSFSYIKGQLGLQDAKELKLGTPFDYQKQMLIYIVDDGPHPGTEQFDALIADTVTQVASTTSGRLLGLFTSHASVAAAYRNSLAKLNKANIKLLAQRLTGGRHAIAARFSKIHASVLLGTYSFWEGFDVPGESLSTILIPKLPFDRPNDPVIEAVSEAEGMGAFVQLSVPHMILKLRQGIGRLIRSHEDHGAVIILDGRFLQQEYGRQVLGSLPPATIHIGSSSEIIPTLTSWFGEEQLAAWRRQLVEENQAAPAAKK